MFKINIRHCMCIRQNTESEIVDFLENLAAKEAIKKVELYNTKKMYDNDSWRCSSC